MPPTATKASAPPIEAEATPAQPLTVVPRESAPTRLAVPTCRNLAEALAAAQQKCQRVSKDSTNAYHKYNYASSEAVIEAAQHALAGTGLSLLPLEQSLNGWERTGENRFELTRKFLLLHASGESLPLQVAWPVVPEKGRPLDKATAIAATLSLAYLLRDLLLMPRVNPEDEVAAREDRPAPAAKPAKAPATTKAAPPLPKDGDELRARLGAKDAELAAAGRCKVGELLAAVDRWGTENQLSVNVEEWDAACFPTLFEFVKSFCAKHPAKKGA